MKPLILGNLSYLHKPRNYTVGIIKRIKKPRHRVSGSEVGATTRAQTRYWCTAHQCTFTFDEKITFAARKHNEWTHMKAHATI